MPFYSASGHKERKVVKSYDINKEYDDLFVIYTTLYLIKQESDFTNFDPILHVVSSYDIGYIFVNCNWVVTRWQ